jgi:photosystem II stability/assembly factor-like uncharacterized protein
MLIVPVMQPSAARPALAADWQPTGLTDPATRLYAPASGAFFARTEAALMRSDDGGAQWHPVALPPLLTDQIFKRSVVAVDPNDHTRIYVGNWASRDDGATWGRLDESANDADSTITPVASGADPSLLYLGVVQGRPGVADLRLERSVDGGSTWVTGLKLGYADFRPSAGIGITLFAAHPSDPNVAFQGIVGFRGNGNQTSLRRTDDQGKTWNEVFYKVVRYPVQIVGGQGANPSRFYVAMSSEEQPSLVARSDDGGITWVETAALSEMPAHQEIYGLAYDQTNPDRVWVAPIKGSILASEDGGASWTAISPPEWEVSDLALGVDGASLYAAGKQGVMRLPLR